MEDNKILTILEELSSVAGVDLSDSQMKHAVGCIIAKHLIGAQMDRTYTFDASIFLNNHESV